MNKENLPGIIAIFIGTIATVIVIALLINGLWHSTNLPLIGTVFLWILTGLVAGASFLALSWFYVFIKGRYKSQRLIYKNPSSNIFVYEDPHTQEIKVFGVAPFTTLQPLSSPTDTNAIDSTNTSAASNSPSNGHTPSAQNNQSNP